MYIFIKQNIHALMINTVQEKLAPPPPQLWHIFLLDADTCHCNLKLYSMIIKQLTLKEIFLTWEKSKSHSSAMYSAYCNKNVFFLNY